MIKKVSLLTVVLAVSTSVLVSGQSSSIEPTGADELDARAVSAFVESLRDISQYVTEDGRLHLAGVTSMRVDQSGHFVVGIRRNGDFDLDPTFSMPIALSLDRDRELRATGIIAITATEDGFVLTIESSAAPVRNGHASATRCQVEIPFPSGSPTCGCSGESCCIGTGESCFWKFKDQNTIICDCTDYVK